GLAVALGSVGIVMALTWLILEFIDKIYALLGKTVCLVLSKILCLFIAAVGMHLMMQGLMHYRSS
ncbi:MAG: hypothetical protein JW937_06525, partial [Candidatus Omnitrophica bacterium]|nr:hypothetical protein [Candidatus Omnitrophota bacterium]